MSVAQALLKCVGKTSSGPPSNVGNWCAGGLLSEIIRSIDNGVTWSTVPLPAQHSAFGMAANASTFIVVGSSGYVARSTDNGATWTALTRGLNSGNVNANFRTIFSVGNVWVATGADGYASRSIDDGVTWTALPQGLNSGLVNATFYRITANGTNWVAVGSFGYASRSIDNGVTWSALPRGLASGNQVDIITNIHNNGAVFVANTNPPSRSTDSGATWQLTDATLVGEASANYGNIWNFTSSPRAVTRSLDNCVTAVLPTINSGLDENGKDMDNRGAVFMAVAGSQVTRSTDSGATWAISVPSTELNFLSIASNKV